MKSVLILLSTYNGSKYLKEQINSILLQQDVKCSLLVRDDGSHDGTVKLLHDIELDYKNRIKIIEGENEGVYNSFSALVKYASQECPQYDYYAFSDQDDIWLPDKIKSAVNMLSPLSKSKPLVYCSNSTMINKDGKKIKNLWREHEPVLNKNRILFVNYAQGCTMVFNKLALDMYCERAYKLGKLHDYMLALIGIYYGEMVYDENSYLLYRQHEGNVVGGNKKKYNRIQTLKNLLLYDSKRNEFCHGILEHFQDINIEDTNRIKRVANYRNNIISKLRLLFYRPIYYKTFRENLLIGIRVLLGTF